MVKIEMLRNKLGSNDGVTVRHYEKGQTYEVSAELAKVFSAEKDAVLITDELPPSMADDEKAEPEAPKNKAEKVAKNKAG